MKFLQTMFLNIEKIENELVSCIEEIRNKFKLDLTITKEFIPGKCGIQSQILVTVMGRIANKLGVNIPDNCYIFHDKKHRKQLSIKQAAQKLLKVVKNEK